MKTKVVGEMQAIGEEGVWLERSLEVSGEEGKVKNRQQVRVLSGVGWRMGQGSGLYECYQVQACIAH